MAVSAMQRQLTCLCHPSKTNKFQRATDQDTKVQFCLLNHDSSNHGATSQRHCEASICNNNVMAILTSVSVYSSI